MNTPSQQPTPKELRQFGFIVGGVFSVIGLWPTVFRGESPRLWAMILGCLLIVLGAIAPLYLKQVHRGWMKIGHVLGSINTRIILGIIYYLLITPMGIVMRLMGKDPMRRAVGGKVDTYRVIRSVRPRHHMRNQF
ncbi:MAG: SxtJ family membrane protein [Nitrospira sp.]|nr:SxtJ family membrane protein [Nitrospira sp.]MDH4244003.1 SxtJ family membrane protein [Nitrospira sp.]MDH4355875.1 SxtJ family membrane protein [Nitrospira sp.]MDH5317911.1 SxtJ family membrane protein [Nitrospira sp.]